MYLEVYAHYMSSRSQRNNYYDDHHQSNSLVMEHRSSTGVCHLTLNLAVTVALCHISLLIHCCVPPSVSEPPSLILLLWVPLKGCLSHMSIWSPQRVASPTPHSFFQLLFYKSLPCLPPQLFFSDCTEPPNLEDSPQHSLKNTCNFWFSSLVSLHVSAPYKSTIFTFDPKTLNLVLVVSDMDCYVSLTLQTPSLPSQFIP